jgi:hypothetical protein
MKPASATTLESIPSSHTDVWELSPKAPRRLRMGRIFEAEGDEASPISTIKLITLAFDH